MDEKEKLIKEHHNVKFLKEFLSLLDAILICGFGMTLLLWITTYNLPQTSIYKVSENLWPTQIILSICLSIVVIKLYEKEKTLKEQIGIKNEQKV